LIINGSPIVVQKRNSLPTKQTSSAYALDCSYKPNGFREGFQHGAENTFCEATPSIANSRKWQASHPSHAHEGDYKCTMSIANPQNGNQNNHVHRIPATMAAKQPIHRMPAKSTTNVPFPSLTRKMATKSKHVLRIPATVATTQPHPSHGRQSDHQFANPSLPAKWQQEQPCPSHTRDNGNITTPSIACT
jgi:hypothetical protein